MSKLGTSLAQQEREQYGKENNSVSYITTDSLKNTTDVIKEESKFQNSDEMMDVLRVNEDDMEVATVFENSNTESPQTDMFSHLQPSKSVTVNMKSLEEPTNEQSHEESMAEEPNSVFLPDESKLFRNPLIELGRMLWPSTEKMQSFTKGCMWSPDGTCILVPVNGDGMHVVELPKDLYKVQELNVDRRLSTLTSALHVKESGTVYDCCWYPFMQSSEPTTCCWLSTRHSEPIHMWDAFRGDLRCSYRGYNDADEMEAAISIIFNNGGDQIIAGYKKAIKIFVTNVPGRNYTNIKVNNPVSCFALTRDNDNYVTAGNWRGYINHFDLRVPTSGPLFTLKGYSCGVTWLKYSPTMQHSWYLFSGARKDNKILQWDMRNYTEPLQIFERTVNTNQRIYFDLTPLNNWLVSGDTEGLLRIWNLADKDQQYELHLHQDCCNGVSFHPSIPIISTTSGQYHPSCYSGEPVEKFIDYENSLLLLWYGRSKENEN